MDTPNLKTEEGRNQLTAMYEKDKSSVGEKMMELVKEYESAKGLLGPLKRFMLNNKFEKVWKEVLNSAQKPQAEAIGVKRTSEYVSIPQALAGKSPDLSNPNGIYGKFPDLSNPTQKIYSNVGLVQKPQNHKYGPAPSSVNSKSQYGPAPSSVNSKSQYGPPSFLPQTTNISVDGSVQDSEVEGQRRPAPATPPQFFDAVYKGDIPTVKDMLDNHPALINATDEKGKTALQVAKQSGNVDLEKYIEGQGENVQKYSNKTLETGDIQR